MENQYRPPVNKGNLHRNQYKDSDNHPDYKGTLNISGEVVKAVGMDQTQNKNGGKYFRYRNRAARGVCFFKLVPANLESPPSEGPGGPRPGDSSLDEGYAVFDQ